MVTAHPLLDAHRPVAGMVALLNRQAPCQQPACVAASKVRRFVPPIVPPTGADANKFYWVSAPNVVPLGVTNRTGKRNRAGRVSFALSVRCRVPWSQVVRQLQRRLLGWHCWFGGRVSEPLLPHRAVERRCPADWALWLPRRAAWRCAAHRLPFFRPACYMVLSALPRRCIFC